MDNIIKELYAVIEDRKENRDDKSYTSYLNKGIDKILKKLGEECVEVIISVKSNFKEEQILEPGDLIYDKETLKQQVQTSEDSIRIISTE